MGLILADNKKISLGELSTPRALSAMPFGGRYRIIDFMLSDMVNSGIKNVGLLTYNKYKSLMDHTGTGAAWSLDRKNDGLHILPPYVNSEASSTISDEELTGVMDFLRQSRSTYVIVTGSNIILNTTFDDFIRSHEESGADISVMYNRDGTKYGNPSYILDIDEDGFVRDMLYNPPKAASSKCSLGILCLRRDLLIDIIAKQMAHGTTHFGIHSIVKMFDCSMQANWLPDDRHTIKVAGSYMHLDLAVLILYGLEQAEANPRWDIFADISFVSNYGSKDARRWQP